MESLLRSVATPDRFVRLRLQESQLTVTRGNQTSQPVTKVWNYADAFSARVAYIEMVRALIQRGYQEQIQGPAQPCPDPTPSDGSPPPFLLELFEDEQPHGSSDDAVPGASLPARQETATRRGRTRRRVAADNQSRTRTSASYGEFLWVFLMFGAVLFGTVVVLSALQVTGPPPLIGTWQTASIDLETDQGMRVHSRRIYQFEEGGIVYFTTDATGIVMAGRYQVDGDEIAMHVGYVLDGEAHQYAFAYRFEVSPTALTLTDLDRGRRMTLTRVKDRDLAQQWVPAITVER